MQIILKKTKFANGSIPLSRPLIVVTWVVTGAPLYTLLSNASKFTAFFASKGLEIFVFNPKFKNLWLRHWCVLYYQTKSALLFFRRSESLPNNGLVVVEWCFFPSRFRRQLKNFDFSMKRIKNTQRKQLSRVHEWVFMYTIETIGR